MTMVRTNSTQAVLEESGALPTPKRGRACIVAIQAMLVFGFGGWLLLAPPAQGMMMLVPLSPAAAQVLPALALQDDTRLVATGPVPGSLLVYGRRATLLGKLFAHGIVTFASPPGGCEAGITA